MPRLTRPLLNAMARSLGAALAGAGFDGGDFDGENQEHYERALDWVQERLDRSGPPKGKAALRKYAEKARHAPG